VSAPKALANGLQMSLKKQGAPLALAGVVSEVTQAQIVVPVE
jgi:hypothetical protein